MPFVKGQSGNPAGRPRINPEIKQMFEAKGQEAFEVTVKLMGSEDARVALAAAQNVMDRAYGKPAQTIVGGDETENPVRMTFEWQTTPPSA